MAKKPPPKNKKKGAKKGAGQGTPRNAAEVRLSEHPRATASIRQLKSWAGLAGFGLSGYAAWKGGAPFVDSALRALFWGVVAYFVVWVCAVQVWRHLAIAEVRAAEQRWREAREEQQRLARERAEAAREAQAAATARS